MTRNRLDNYERVVETVDQARRKQICPGVPTFIARLLGLRRQRGHDQKLRQQQDETWAALSEEDKDWYDPLAVKIGMQASAQDIPAQGWPDSFDPDIAGKILMQLDELIAAEEAEVEAWHQSLR